MYYGRQIKPDQWKKYLVNVIWYAAHTVPFFFNFWGTPKTWQICHQINSFFVNKKWRKVKENFFFTISADSQSKYVFKNKLVDTNKIHHFLTIMIMSTWEHGPSWLFMVLGESIVSAYYLHIYITAFSYSTKVTVDINNSFKKEEEK